MLGGIGNEVLDTAHDIVEERIAVDKGAETGNLACDGSADLGLVVLQKLDKGGDKISRNDFFIDGLGNL